MTGGGTKSRNIRNYNITDVFELSRGKSVKFQSNVEHETKRLRDLRERKGKLLSTIEDWKRCPQSYRRRLYKRLQYIDISKNEAYSKLDEISREVGMLAFNLRLNPTWIRGLLKLIDEILDQTETDQRRHLSMELDQFKAQLGFLKSGCKLFQLEL